MSTETVRSGFDTWAGSGKPSREHPREKALRLKTGENEAFLWLRNPAPRNATVTSATLTLRAKGASSGARVVSIHRVTESWKEGRLNWNNKPTSTSAQATAAIGALDDGDEITFDVTSIVAAWASGTANYGFRITTDAGTTHKISGLNSAHKPTLSVSWQDAPAAPTNLRPSGAATSLAKPHVTFDYLDVSGNTALAAVQVQIDDVSDFLTPLFDSGEVLTDSPGLDLAGTAYAGLAEGETVYWRARAKDGAGLWSEWSDAVTMTKTAKPTVTITNLGAGLFTEPTPPVMWSMPGQVQWRVLVFDKASPAKPVADSRQRTGAETSWTLPEGVLKDGHTYTVEVRGWDDVVREATPGDDTFAVARADSTLASDPTTNAVESLTAVQVEVTPWVDLTWTRTITPDSFALYRDGQVVKSDLDPADVFVSGTTYTYRYYGARPNREHVYSVRAIVNGKMSPAGPTASLTTSPSGLWLVDRDRGIYVTLWGDDEGSWTMEDDASVYTPVGSTEVVRVVNGMRGLEGSLSGLLMEGFGKTFEQLEADLYSIKEQPSETVRIIAGDENFEALIGNVRISPKPQTRQGQIVKAVSLDFWQTGDLPFDAHV